MGKKGKRLSSRDSILSDKKFIASIYEEGINTILERNPTFKRNEDYLVRHIDKRKLNKKIEELYNDSKLRSVQNLETKKNYFRENLADYISSGGIFDEKGKEIILKGGLESKAEGGFFKGFFARRKLKGEKYLENTIEAFQDLYSLFKTEDYAQRMPELEKAVNTINDMGFLNPALDILKSYGLINDRKYSLLKKSIGKTTKKNVEYAVSGIENYITQQAVAAVLGVFGALMVLTSSNMTGGVIGSLGSGLIQLLGAVLFLVALSMFFLIQRKKKKKISKSKKSKTFKNR